MFSFSLFIVLRLPAAAKVIDRLDFRTKVRVYAPSVRVGEVAELAGVNVETLRYYERRGLLPTPDRAASGHRIYDEERSRLCARRFYTSRTAKARETPCD
jgi:hypothetical protein